MQKNWQIRKKKKMALIEKLKPNYKFKWEHENFPTDACVNVHIMQWMDFVAQLNWYFLPSREQDGQISNTHHLYLSYQANQKERNECISWSSFDQKN